MLASHFRLGNEATNQNLSRVSPRLSLPSMRCSNLLAACCFYSAYLSISKARSNRSLVFPWRSADHSHREIRGEDDEWTIEEWVPMLLRRRKLGTQDVFATKRLVWLEQEVVTPQRRNSGCGIRQQLVCAMLHNWAPHHGCQSPTARVILAGWHGRWFYIFEYVSVPKHVA